MALIEYVVNDWRNYRSYCHGFFQHLFIVCKPLPCGDRANEISSHLLQFFCQKSLKPVLRVLLLGHYGFLTIFMRDRKRLL